MNLSDKIQQAITEVPDFPQPGISFKDITTLFENSALCNEILDEMELIYRPQKFDAVVALESRGFLFGFALALRLNIPFVMLRKKGKLPRSTFSQSYALEYGNATIEVHQDALKKGSKVLIHDDVLATGGTAEAAALLIEQAGAVPGGFNFIAELTFLNGRDKLTPICSDISTFVQY